jgi:hypothetical protein
LDSRPTRISSLHLPPSVGCRPFQVATDVAGPTPGHSPLPRALGLSDWAAGLFHDPGTGGPPPPGSHDQSLAPAGHVLTGLPDLQLPRSARPA